MTREDAIQVLESMKSEESYNALIDLCNMAIEALQADAVYGEWQKVEEQPYFRKHYDTVCCSVCRKKGNRKWNYCPSCGARMTLYKGGDTE